MRLYQLSLVQLPRMLRDRFWLKVGSYYLIRFFFFHVPTLENRSDAECTYGLVSVEVDFMP